MGKSKHPRPWGDPFQFANDEDGLEQAEPFSGAVDGEENVTELLDEAHDALSRLYSKTNKRTKAAKIPRKIHSWQ